MEMMANRASIHALVDDLAEEQLELAKKAREDIDPSDFAALASVAGRLLARYG